jgi:DNA-binding NtrC family response regulator
MASVLLVDDDSEILRSLERLLTLHGFEVWSAGSVREALRQLRAHGESDFLITDLIMDDEDGLTLIRQIRESHPETRIVAISGGGHSKPDSYLAAARRLGAEATFRKPVPPDQLLAFLRSASHSDASRKDLG